MHALSAEFTFINELCRLFVYFEVYVLYVMCNVCCNVCCGSVDRASSVLVVGIYMCVYAYNYYIVVGIIMISSMQSICLIWYYMGNIYFPDRGNK